MTAGALILICTEAQSQQTVHTCSLGANKLKGGTRGGQGRKVDGDAPGLENDAGVNIFTQQVQLICALNHVRIPLS